MCISGHVPWVREAHHHSTAGKVEHAHTAPKHARMAHEGRTRASASGWYASMWEKKGPAPRAQLYDTTAPAGSAVVALAEILATAQSASTAVFLVSRCKQERRQISGFLGTPAGQRQIQCRENGLLHVRHRATTFVVQRHTNVERHVEVEGQELQVRLKPNRPS